MGLIFCGILDLFIDLISSRIRVMLTDILQAETVVCPAPVSALKEHEPAA